MHNLKFKTIKTPDNQIFTKYEFYSYRNKISIVRVKNLRT